MKHLGPKATKWCWISILLAICAILLFATRSAYQSGDSLGYAASARTGGICMFHPHHLIFTPVIHVLHFSILDALSIESDIITTGQLHNIGWAIVTLLSVYLLVLRLTHHVPLALSATAMLFASLGFLTFTTWVEVYVPALGNLAALAAVLVYAGDGQLTRARLALSIALLSMAILYHQTNVLILLPLSVYFFLSPARRLHEYFAIVVCSAAIVMTLYIVVYICRSPDRTLTGFTHFCLSYTFHPNPSWGSWSNISVKGVKSLVASQTWNIFLVPWRLRVPIKVFVALVVACVFGWQMFQLARVTDYRGIRAFLILWTGTYFCFFLWWLPFEPEFFLATLVPLIVLGTMTLTDVVSLALPHRLGFLSACILGIISAFLLVRNLPCVVNHHLHRGDAYTEAQQISRLATPSTFVMTDYAVQQNLSFYFGCQTFETVIPLLSFYRQHAMDLYYAQATNTTLLIRVGEIAPTETMSGFSADSHPAEWLAFLAWLFTFEYDSLGDVATCRAFDRATEDTDTDWIVLRNTRQHVTGLRDFLVRLDRARGTSIKNAELRFDQWFQRTSPTMKCTVQEMVRSRAISYLGE